MSEPPTGETESGSWPATWPTPHGMGNDGPRSNGPTGCELGRAVTRLEWPTPRVADCVSGADFGSSAKHEGGGNLLGAVIAGPPDPANPSTPGRPRGSLNPDWVSQLMGFPDGWLDGIESGD